MKKFLLSTAFSIVTIFAMAQSYPCVDNTITVTGNNGGGSTCQSEMNGYKAGGQINITFLFKATEAPIIDAVYDLSVSNTTPLDVYFSSGILSADGLKATYCYYTSKPNLNLANGQQSYRFSIHYASKVGGTPCEVAEAPIPLPVKLKSFNASRNNATVNLTWVTSSEQNNRGFELQRLTGAGEWKTIAFIFSQAENGNSGTDLSYSYNDANNYKGLSQYRLMQVNMDEKVSFSQVRSVRGQEQASKTIISPNPSTGGHVNVVFEDAAATKDILLTDAVGRLVKKWNNYSDNSLQINNLQTGFYQLSILNKATGLQSVEKIVVTAK